VNYIGLGLALIIGALGLYFIQRPYPVTTVAYTVGIIDSNKIKSEAKPFLNVKEIIDAAHSAAHQEILEKEKELRKEYEALRDAKNDGTKLKELKANFDKKVVALEQTVLQKKERVTRQFSVLSQNLEGKLKETIGRIAHEKKISLVLNKYIQETQAILFAESVLDITDEVIAQIEKEPLDLSLPAE
jgi:Skp family chaperone for outer membrane proteins